MIQKYQKIIIQQQLSFSSIFSYFSYLASVLFLSYFLLHTPNDAITYYSIAER